MPPNISLQYIASCKIFQKYSALALDKFYISCYAQPGIRSFSTKNRSSSSSIPQKPPARIHCRLSNRPRTHAAIQHQVFTLRPLFLHSEIRSAHRVTLFCPFSRCNSVRIMKKHPRTADGIRVSHIPSAAIQEYSFTLFNLPQVAVSVDATVSKHY